MYNVIAHEIQINRFVKLEKRKLYENVCVCR